MCMYISCKNFIPQYMLGLHLLRHLNQLRPNQQVDNQLKAMCPGHLHLHLFPFLEHAHYHRHPRVARIAVLRGVTTHQYENGSVPGEILTHPKLTIETEWTGVHEQIISLFQEE